MSENLSKYEQESHMKIFKESVNKEQFEGIYIRGSFEEPALVLSIDRIPNKAGLNILKNTVKFSDDKELFIYLYVNGKGFKLGKIDRDIDQIYLLDELLKRYNLKMMEIVDGKKSWVNTDHFITTMKL